MNPLLKIKQTIDILFGRGVSRYFPKKTDITFSKKTGRIRAVSHEGNLLCTLRIDGGLAITPYLAQILIKSKKFKENCVEVSSEAAPFVEEGRSAFAKHIIWCGKNIKIASDTPVLYKNKVIAVGKAALSSEMIKDLKRGVAVKVRDSLKSRKENQKL